MANHLAKSQVKLISEWMIKPKNDIKQSKHPDYVLGPGDLLHLSTQYMQFGLLYSTKPSTFNIHHHLLDRLKHAVSHALAYYYPLAGRLATVKYEDEHACSIHVDCQNGPGARFIHASATDDGVSVDHIVAYSPAVLPTVRSFFDLGERAVINYDGHYRPLLTIQVTELVDGVFIGFTMNHALADGTSFWKFVNVLSEIFELISNNNLESVTISHAPIFEPIYPYGYGPVIKLPYLHPDEFLIRFNMELQLTERFFHFSPPSLAKLKARVNAGFDDESNKISSFQALSALVWRSITRARSLLPEEITACTLVGDARARVDPPLCPNHFGNICFLAQGIATAGELLENELGWAAKLLHKAVLAQDDKAIRGLLKNFIKAPFAKRSTKTGPIFGPNSVLFGNSPRFDVYGPEFGLGKAIAVRSGYFDKRDGKVMAYPGCEGGESVELEICLSPRTMKALESDQEFMSFVS